MTKKKYTGTVLSPGFKTKKKVYPTGSKWETDHKLSYEHLINTKRIEK